MKRCITTRFYLDEPAGKNAWQKVQQRQKRDNRSCSQAIIALLNEHDESVLSEAQLKELSNKIIDQMVAELQRTLPAFIAGCVTGDAQSGHIQADVHSDNTPQMQSNTFPNVEEMSPPDFRQGAIDLGFLGR